MLGLLVLIIPAMIVSGGYAAIPGFDNRSLSRDSASALPGASSGLPGASSGLRLSHPDYLNTPEISDFPPASIKHACGTVFYDRSGDGRSVSSAGNGAAGVASVLGRSAMAGREGKLQGVNPWRSIGAVAFVLGGLLCISAFLRQRQGFGVKVGKHKSLKIIERLAFDSKRSIVLLEVDGRRLLVGAGSEHIDKLADLEPEGEDDDISTSDSKWFQFSEKARPAGGVGVPDLRLAQGGVEKI